MLKGNNRNIMVAMTVIILTLVLILATGSYNSEQGSVFGQQVSQNQQEQYVFVAKWGTGGDAAGEFDRPHDLDFNPSEDRLYAVDRDNNRVQIFDKNGTYLYEWGSDGEGDGEFHVPYGVDVDSSGNVWIADRGNHRMQKFDPEGEFLMKVGSTDSLGPGSELGQFDNPRHVAVDDELEYFYVADSKNNRIQKFDINGTFVTSFGSLGSGAGQFDLPTTIVIDSNGDLYVNERGNERVQKLDTEGNPILMFGSRGSGSNQFCHIEHLGIDEFDNIYVTDPQSEDGCSLEPKVKKFDSEGNFITEWGTFGEGDGQFEDPEHLAIDSRGYVYVSDRSNNNIQVFRPVTVKSSDQLLDIEGNLVSIR
jgi:tripartite motif-containing protein 71